MACPSPRPSWAQLGGAESRWGAGKEGERGVGLPTSLVSCSLARRLFGKWGEGVKGRGRGAHCLVHLLNQSLSGDTGQCWLWACSPEGAGEGLLSVKCPTPHLLLVPSMFQNLALLNSDHTVYCLNSWILLSAKRVLLVITPGPSQVNQAITSAYLKDPTPHRHYLLTSWPWLGMGPSLHLNNYPLPHLR